MYMGRWGASRLAFAARAKAKAAAVTAAAVLKANPPGLSVGLPWVTLHNGAVAGQQIFQWTNGWGVLGRGVSHAAGWGPINRLIYQAYTLSTQAETDARIAQITAYYNAQNSGGGLFSALATLADLAGSIITAPVRITNNATKAALHGGSIRGAVTHTNIGHTSVLKVGQVAGAATAVYLTAGAAGTAIGAQAFSAGLVNASVGMGLSDVMAMSALGGMAASGGMQIATRGYISPTAMAKTGVKAAIAGGSSSLVAGIADGNQTYQTYKTVRGVQSLKAQIDLYQQQKHIGALNAAQQAELDSLMKQIAIEQAKPLSPGVAAGTTTNTAAQSNPVPLVAGGLVALKLLAFL
jgi:hypothetical protein